MIDKLKSALDNSSFAEAKELINEISTSEEYSDEALELIVRALKSGDNSLMDLANNILLYLPSEFHKNASSELSKIIEFGNISARNTSGEILRSYNQDALEDLVRLLKSTDFDVRKFACDVIGLIGERSVENDIIPLLFDDDVNVRTSAVETLGNIKSKDSVQDLIELFNREVELQNNIIDSIGKIGGEEAEDFLLDLFEHNDDEFIKILAIEALAHCGSRMQVVYAVVNHMKDFNEEVKKVILKTVTAIPYRLNERYKIPKKHRHIAHLALEDDDEDLKLSGMTALGNDLEKSDVAPLVKLATQNNENINQVMLINLIESHNDEVIREFIEQLVTSETPETIVNMAITASFLYNEAGMTNMKQFMELTIEISKEKNPQILEDLDISEN